MARKAKGADAKASFARLNRVWTDVSPSDWLGWLAESKPESMFHASGPHIKGRCPFHDDSTASFIVTPYKGIVRCFGCHRMFWNPVYFIAEMNKTSVADALIFAKKRWGLSAAIPKELFEKVRDHEVYQRNKATLMKFFSALLFQALSSYARGAMEAEHLLWAQPTCEYLANRKLGESAPNETVAESDQPNGEFDQYGVWITLCNRELIGIFPPTVVVENHFGTGSEEFKFFRSYFAEQVEDFTKVGALMFPYDDTPTSLCRFKMRAPETPCVHQIWVKDAYEAEMDGFRGFYGLRYYQTYLSLQDHGMDGPKDGFTAHLSEGEFDILSVITQQIRRVSDDYIALGLGGGSAQSIDRLLSMGISRACLMPDNDPGGIKFVRQVLEETKSKVLAYRVFRWPDEYTDWHDPSRPGSKIKDTDDAIREIGYPRWVRYALNYEHAYGTLDEWCYDRASYEVAKAGTTDTQTIDRIAKGWGTLLRNEQVCTTYCNAIAKDHGLDSVVLRREILVKEDNEEEFIKRLYTTLLDKYHPVGIQNAEGRKQVMLLWNKTNRVTDSVVLNDERSAETFIAKQYGPIYDFVAKTVSDPPFIVGDDPETSQFNVTMKAKKYREYLNYALLMMAKDLPTMDHAPTRGQGLHTIDAADERMRSYMINGRDVYCFMHDGPSFTATLLDGPRHEGIVFDNSGEAWAETVTKADDFSAQVDLVGLFTRVRGMIEAGWTFRHQSVDATFLAAYVMGLTVFTVFTRQTAIILNAEHESGKSKFTSGFIGGSAKSINVIAHAVAMQGYTAASIRQQRNNSSLCLCLEEFEDYGGNDPKSIAVRKVLELCRDLISESAVNWSIGTTSGESRTYHLRFPLVACAIRPLRDAASLSRFVQFELIKDTGHGDPVDLIVGKYGPALIKQTRHEMVVGLVPRMLELRVAQTAVAKEYAAGTQLPAHASSRFREALYPVLSMLKFLGELPGGAGVIPDYRQFAYDFSESRREQLARLKSTSQDEQIFETIMGSPIQVASVGDQSLSSGDTNIRMLLKDLNKLDDVNKTKRGVYLDIKMEWLIVNWVEAQQGVLAQSKYRNDQPTYLKDIAQRSPYHITTDSVKQARVLERMVDVMGPCQPIDLISVFSVKHYLDAVRAQRDAAMAKVAEPTAKTAEVDPDKVQGEEDDDIVV
jgi:CHC2 zinc finger/Toprim-like